MAGAIAGSAIFCCSPTERLDTVTLTVNNACNLACPHCYLQYHSPVKKFRESLFDVLERSAFRHPAVVGKEPLFDGGSVAICERLAALSIRSKKRSEERRVGKEC